METIINPIQTHERAPTEIKTQAIAAAVAAAMAHTHEDNGSKFEFDNNDNELAYRMH